MNPDRADCAELALKAAGHAPRDHGAAEAITELMLDLRHYAERMEIVPHECWNESSERLIAEAQADLLKD